MNHRYFDTVKPLTTTFSTFMKSWASPGNRFTTGRMKQHFSKVANNFRTSVNQAFLAHRYMSNCYNLNMF
ncbi:MAG: hypothetical protein JWO78_1626 [Micavibrio sp.]|nr:hypothetical protein [Micavibrio sp.]